MQSQSYTIAKFSEKFSQITTLKAIISLIKGDPKLEFLVRVVLPELVWNAKDDTIMGSKALIYPKIIVNGEVHEPCWDFEVKSLLGLEDAYINALKHVVSNLKQD